MRLEEEGLVDVFPQYATVVSRIDVRLAQQAHFLRQAVELEIVRGLAISHDGALVGRTERSDRAPAAICQGRRVREIHDRRQ